MSIVGLHPESGVRIVLERPRDGGPPWVYEGTAYTPQSSYAIHATVQAEGGVAVHGSDAPADLLSRVRMMVRSAYKHAKTESPDQPPPRQIHRWRSER